MSESNNFFHEIENAIKENNQVFFTENLDKIKIFFENNESLKDQIYHTLAGSYLTDEFEDPEDLDPIYSSQHENDFKRNDYYTLSDIQKNYLGSLRFLVTSGVINPNYIFQITTGTANTLLSVSMRLSGHCYYHELRTKFLFEVTSPETMRNYRDENGFTMVNYLKWPQEEGHIHEDYFDKCMKKLLSYGVECI